MDKTTNNRTEKPCVVCKNRAEFAIDVFQWVVIDIENCPDLNSKDFVFVCGDHKNVTVDDVVKIVTTEPSDD